MQKLRSTKIKNVLPTAVSKEIKNMRYKREGYSRYKWLIELRNGKRLLLKVSEKRDKRYSLKKEAYVCNLLRKHRIPTPRVIKYGNFLLNGEKYEYLLVTLLEGFILKKIFFALPRKEQCRVLCNVSALLGRMHSIKFKKYGDIDEDGGIVSGEQVSFKTIKQKYKRFGISWEWLVFSKAYKYLGVLMACKVIDKRFVIRIIDFLNKYKKIFETPGPPRFVHNDFKFDHVLIKKNKKREIAGIIDFELAASYPKEYDFIRLHKEGIFDDKHLKECLLRGYKKYQRISKDFELRVLIYRLIQELGHAKNAIKSEGMNSAKRICIDMIRIMNKYGL